MLISRHCSGIALALSLAVSPLSMASDAVSSDSAEPWTGGVFDYRDPSAPATPEPLIEVRDPPLSDSEGNTNELVILPDYSDGSFIRSIVPSVARGVDLRPEDVLINAINGKVPATLSAFAGPVKADYMVHSARRAENKRRQVGDATFEELLRFMVVSYPTVKAALAAEKRLKNTRGITSVTIGKLAQYAFTPNDPYFGVKSEPKLYQWGLHAMNFPSAWDRTKGHAYIGVIDDFKVISGHQDAGNIRGHLETMYLTPSSQWGYHGWHTAGIIAASQNNGLGVSGVCPTCSIIPGKIGNISLHGATDLIIQLYERGVQVINMSFETTSTYTCASAPPGSFEYNFCHAANQAAARDILLVAAAGNFYKSEPAFPARSAPMFAVGGLQKLANASAPTWWVSESYNPTQGGASSWAGYNGVVGPARAVVSTVPPGGYSNTFPQYLCGDIVGVDESASTSAQYGDGYGSCSGTSMAAPHITGLAGILRSINPRLSAESIKMKIRESTGTHTPDPIWGWGLPLANNAVTSVINNTNPSRLTPLFSFYSDGRKDYFYTTVPQMAVAAVEGTLRPAVNPYATEADFGTVGTTISGYAGFPGVTTGGTRTPRAQAWIFTTPENPKVPSVPLVPLYRMSWKCGDLAASTINVCGTYPHHTDFVYTTDSAGISVLGQYGYKLDGIEGYVYPKTISQPAGTVRLMRKYNPQRDDHAIFPDIEPIRTDMANQGYTLNSGSDWLGYVYPNTGSMPAI